MKTNPMKRITTIALALVVTFALGAGASYAQGNVPNGTVTDGNLVWLKNANCFGGQRWQTARNSAAGLHSGMCGLNDGSTAGQWRLPTPDELVNRLRNSKEFTNVQSEYWSSKGNGSDCAYYVPSGFYHVWSAQQWHTFGVLPVRSRQ